jgi:aryl-alcohol dehydrogenase-like predicted oxidoreductase
MEYRRLGKSELEVTEISLGAWSYGHDSWSDIDDDVSIRTIHKAIDYGITLIDTAPAYGNGYSETIVGRAIEGKRDKVIVATKCTADAKTIPEQADASLKRLGVECIDLYQVHYPSAEIPICETIGAVAELKKQGKIRHIGVSNFSVKQLKEAVATAEITSCQSPFNLLWREIEVQGVLDFCLENNIGILSYSSIAQGLLTGKFENREDIPATKGEARTRNVLFKEGTFEAALGAVEFMKQIAPKYGKTLTQLAINWVINRPGITTSLVGARNMKQLDENVGGQGWQISPEDMKSLDEAGLKVSEILDYTRNMWGFLYAR